MSDIQFQNPYALALLALPIFFFLLMVVRGMAKMRALRSIGDSDLLTRLMSQVSYTRRRIKAFLWLVMLILLAIAAARPTWGVSSEIVEVRDFDLYIIFDTSLSMDAQDVIPSRLERGVLDLRYILENIEQMPFSIVLFANQAVTYMPMTSSLDSADVFIRGIETSALTAQGSNVARAIQEVIVAYEERGTADGAILLLSDGEFFSGDLSTTLEQAQLTNLPIYTIGYGTPEGSLIPTYDETGAAVGFKLDGNGQTVVTRLDSETLQRISLATDAVFVAVTDNTSDVNPIIEAINNQYDNSFVESVENRRSEQFPIFIAIALFMLSLEIVLPETRGEQ